LKLVNTDGIELFQFDQYTRLQSLILIEINDMTLNQIFRFITKYPLKLLSIITCTQSLIKLRATINFLWSTIAQSSLQNRHLDISNVELVREQGQRGVFFDTVRPVSSVLHRLKISISHYREYHQIPSGYALLQTLVIEECTSPGIDQIG
jgi:hypothetical protein